MTILSPRLLLGALLVAGCATTTPPPPAPVHEATGGPAPHRQALPPGPWLLNTADVTRSCGEGGGLVLTQIVQERGWAVTSTGADTRLQVTCQWSGEEVLVWDVDTARATGRCVAPDVARLEVLLEVIDRPYQNSAEAVLAEARFVGRARLSAEPPHRGCVVEQECRKILLARALRSVVQRLPRGPRRPLPLVAPAPEEATGDVAVGRAGPPPTRLPDDPDHKSIYPVDIGARPVPPEASTLARTPGRPRAAVQASGGDPDFRVRPTGSPTDRPELVDRSLRPFWQDLGLVVDLGGGGCTNHCDDLFTAGPAGGAHLLIHFHDLVALDAGWSWTRLGEEERRSEAGDTHADLLAIDVGARLYLRPPGGVRPYAGLGFTQLSIGGPDVPPGVEPQRFLGLGLRLRAGATWPIHGPLSAGFFVRYALVPWERQCRRLDSWSLEGTGCGSVADSDPISGSDVFTAGAELGLGFQ